MSTQATFSFVTETPAAPADEAVQHFASRLALETDPSDVHTDLGRGKDGFVVVDVRTPAAYADLRVPGAVNLPARRIDATSAASMRGRLVVVYCWTHSCNASTKAALRLASLGIQVKEMIGGLEAWVREGYPTEGALQRDVSFDEYLRWHHAGNTGPFRRAS